MNWAQVRGYRDGDNPARWRGHLDKTLPQPTKVKAVEHHEAVPYADAPSFMAELRARMSISAFALEFCILTAARTSEVIGARWDEFSEIEVNGGEKKIPVWTVPAERMKAGREHRIPLSVRALAVLAELPREGEYLFPGARKDKPLSNMAMLELVRGMRGKGPTVHGFRSTFRDWAAEQTAYPNEMCEIALAHAIGDKAEAAYRRGDMMEKRWRLMADWAAYCAGPTAARDNVVSIRESA